MSAEEPTTGADVSRLVAEVQRLRELAASAQADERLAIANADRASDEIEALRAERAALAKVLKVEVGARGGEPLAAALRRVVEERNAAVQNSTIEPLLRCADEVERIIWAFRADDDRRDAVRQLARDIRMWASALVTERDYERKRWAALEEVLGVSKEDSVLAAFGRKEAEVRRLQDVLADLRATAEKLDDAYQDADHYPPVVQTMVDAVRATKAGAT